MNRIKFIIVAMLLLLSTGCQEIQGPTWSSDGQWIAYTVYTHDADGGLHPSVYLASPDADDPTPKLLADNAAFPQWNPKATQLFFLGSRDADGFFTKLYRTNPGKEKPDVALGGLHLNAMQLTSGQTGPLLLLLQGGDSRPGALVTAELWSATDNKRTDLKKLGEMLGPAISANGRMIVYGAKPAEGHPVLMAAEFGQAMEAKAIFPTTTLTEPDATGYVVHSFPDVDRFLFYGPGLRNVWTLSGKPAVAKFAKYTIPDGLSCPVMARIADDSNSATLTFLRATPGRFSYETYRVDFQQSKWTKLDENADEPIGGNASEPKSKKPNAARLAWLSSSGLTVGEAAKPTLFPVTANQHLAASTLMLKAKQPDKALEFALKAQDVVPAPNSEALNRTLYLAFVANGKFDRATDLFEQSWLLEPVDETGLHFLFPAESGLPPVDPEWVALQHRRMDELMAGAPGNRMIPLLKAALSARQKGNYRDAMDAYKKAVDYCPDKARVAGVKFQQAIVELERGEITLAADYFEHAARTEDFPQADFAAGLSALSYLLQGRKEVVGKATALLQLPAVRKSPFAAEFAKIPSMVKGKLAKDHGATPESVSPDDLIHVWAEFDTFWMPWASTHAVGMDVGDKQFSARHVGIKRITVSSIKTNKQKDPILRIALPVSALKLSPSFDSIAFTVSGEIVPVPDNFCELFVLDMTGNVFNGNTQAAVLGRTRGRQIITKFEWKNGGEVALTGVDVDLFGGQRTFEKTVPLGRLTMRRP